MATIKSKALKLAGDKKVGDKIKFTKEGYEPFLPKGSKKEVVRMHGKHPIIKDNTGHELRLNRRAHYE